MESDPRRKKESQSMTMVRLPSTVSGDLMKEKGNTLPLNLLANLLAVLKRPLVVSHSKRPL